MAKVAVKALDSFSHGRLNATIGQRYTINSGDADDLRKAGLVEVEGDADDGVDDLVGGKAEPMTANKMEAKPANKGAK